MVYRRLGNGLALLALFAAEFLPDSWLKSGIVSAGLSYMAVALVLRARTGYLRRRPYWTPESWRKYLAACSFPVAALLVSIAMMMAVEWHLPIAGVANSDARATWASMLIGLMIVGVL